MSAQKPTPRIAYKNDSGEAIPPHAILQLTSDVEVNSNGDISVLVKKPDGGDHFALDEGGGAANDDDGGKYGQCIKALTGLFWAHYVDSSPPSEAWVTEVGPVTGQWYVNSSSSGFVYAGSHEPTNERILVMQLAGGGGAAIGRATTAIAAASSNLTGVGLEFVRFVPDPSIDPQTDPLTLMEETDANGDIVKTKGVNRSTKITANVDAFVKFIRVNGEWDLFSAEDVCIDPTA